MQGTSPTVVTYILLCYILCKPLPPDATLAYVSRPWENLATKPWVTQLPLCFDLGTRCRWDQMRLETKSGQVTLHIRSGFEGCQKKCRSGTSTSTQIGTQVQTINSDGQADRVNEKIRVFVFYATLAKTTYSYSTRASFLHSRQNSYLEVHFMFEGDRGPERRLGGVHGRSCLRAQAA